MPHKNIILLIADDLGRCLGCYGDPTIATPQIDKFAGQGALFSMAFTSTASCSCSRSVIYTGLHTHENGQYGLACGRHHFTTFDHVETAPKIFGSLGYLTGIIGKVHVGPPSAYPWEVREESTTRDVAWVADRAAAFLKKAGEESRPFFLTVGYIDPHRDLTRSGFGNEDTFHSRIKDVKYDPANVTVPEFLNDLPEIRQETANYYSAISRLDQGIGYILDALKQSGHEEDTLVMFVSDNGPPFINSKTTLYDAGVRLPLIVRRPGSKPGVVNPNMVSFIDILPTFLDWAGSPDLKSKRIGRSFLQILNRQDLVDGWQTHVFGSHSFHEITNYYPTRFMRTDRYKYHRNVEWKLNFPFAADLYGSLTWEAIRNSGTHTMGKRPLKSYIQRPPEELYDLQTDPHEVKNLALNPDATHKGQLEKMRAATEEWQRQTEDPWLFRDGVSVVLVKHHVEAGMFLPNRFDFDVEDPGARGYPAYRHIED
ncbi:alkaline-phosphatase-like protein [Leptodontidium sp. 2 PMI_412]|nr:alkaline-phosphatase-like protein [Leptodontidium sp. 2 PMI_412]